MLRSELGLMVRLQSSGPPTFVTKRFDSRLLYFVLLGLSGCVLLFRFGIKTSAVEAVVLSVVALMIGLVVAVRALPPWRGSERDKTIVLVFGVAQLLVVIVISAATR